MFVTKVFVGMVLIVVAVIGIAASCGPSFRRTHQSDAVFSRCFDIDYDPSESPSVKSQCWGEWIDSHLYNQPDDKIRYAEMRRMEIAQGISVPGPPGPPGTFDHRPRLFDAGVFDKSPEDAGSPSTEDHSAPGVSVAVEIETDSCRSDCPEQFPTPKSDKTK